VEAHGSVLEVRSIEGQGTTFQFPLLLAPESRANAHPQNR
jgi:signal transduction histidine kinase